VETPVPTPERVRFAWRGLENRFWAISRNSLLKREQNAWETVKIPGLRDVQYFDVASKQTGFFGWRPPKVWSGHRR